MKPPTRLQGYLAASISIEKMLDDAQKDRPERLPSRWKQTASYREGYFEGLLFASCMTVLGEFPRVPENAQRIRFILATAKTKPETE